MTRAGEHISARTIPPEPCPAHISARTPRPGPAHHRDVHNSALTPKPCPAHIQGWESKD